jgi:hypothetical protein
MFPHQIALRYARGLRRTPEASSRNQEGGVLKRAESARAVVMGQGLVEVSPPVAEPHAGIELRVTCSQMAARDGDTDNGERRRQGGAAVAAGRRRPFPDGRRPIGRIATVPGCLVG